MKRILEFFMPRTAMGFLIYGWLGSFFVTLSIDNYFHGLLELIPTILIWVPLWILAYRARERQIEIAEFLGVLKATAEKAVEEEDRLLAVTHDLREEQE